MDRFLSYLRIPRHYTAGMKGLRWSPSGDAIEFDNGNTFAFPGELWPFLEGFLAQRPLIHFAHILHLLYLLKMKRTPFLGQNEESLPKAFSLAHLPYRNAGVFCALLCKDIPAAPDPPLALSTATFELQVGASEPFFTLQNGDMPPLPPEVFEARLLFALSSYSFEDILHWFRHGRGPVGEAAEDIAETVSLDKPRSLSGVLADLAGRQRLCGAMPFVDRLVSALTLPPQRLQPLELPLGGYSDVATHGQVDQLLPSQFAFDDLEFIRRHAERELLYFRREEPNVSTREELVVLLDQGVRTWGSVRLVLAAALFALGKLAERRRIAFFVSATSDDGALLDPLQADPAALHELVESSDLSPHPGLALERVLSEETATARDIVLLTHPRNLAEADVRTAARRLRGQVRLFAVAVHESGDVQFSEMRRGAPLCRSRFHVDLERTAPPPRQTAADPQTAWRGDIEPVPYPFRFGLADQKAMRFAFDAASEWLLVACHGGILHATRTDGSHSEILPRGLVQGKIVSDVMQVIGVAGGFVIMTVQSKQIFLMHYDFAVRTCTAHRFALVSSATPLRAFYLRKLHTVSIKQNNDLSCVHLSTGKRMPISAAVTSRPPWVSKHDTVVPLPLQNESGPDSPHEAWAWPSIAFASQSGSLRLLYTTPFMERITPLEDNRPVLRDCILVRADCQGHTLAALFTNPFKAEPSMLRLFRGPEGTPLAVFPQNKIEHEFTISSDGRLLARQVGSGSVQIYNLSEAKTPQHVLHLGRFHPQIHVELAENWLTLRIDRTVYLAFWKDNTLVIKQGQWMPPNLLPELERYGLSVNGRSALKSPLPPFLPLDPSKRFRKAAWAGALIAVVSRFGEVALFERSGELVCMFFAFRQQIAVWMPDGTCYGPMALLGRPATPNALDKIGAALKAASQRGERTVV
jgi:hypothetical protein